MDSRADYILEKIAAGFSVNAMQKKGSAYESKADYIMEKQAGLWNLVVKGGKKALKKGKETYKKMKEAWNRPAPVTHRDNLPGSYHHTAQNVLRSERDRLYR